MDLHAAEQCTHYSPLRVSVHVDFADDVEEARRAGDLECGVGEMAVHGVEHQVQRFSVLTLRSLLNVV